MIPGVQLPLYLLSCHTFTPIEKCAILKMAAVWALALFTTRTVSLFLSRRNAMRTEWKRGESDEILSHGSTSRGVILALFMAVAMRQWAGRPCATFLDSWMSFTTPCFHLSSQSFLLHHRTGQYSLTEHSSSLALGPGHGLIALFLSTLEAYD